MTIITGTNGTINDTNMPKKRITEFNFDKAKVLPPAVTRSGIPVRLLSCDRYDSLYRGCIVALLKYPKWERIIAYNKEGKVASALDPSLDLFLYEED
jgi:hypothetical protein